MLPLKNYYPLSDYNGWQKFNGGSVPDGYEVRNFIHCGLMIRKISIKMINTNKKVRFLSDCGRHKYDDFYMTDVVFENDEVCLCKSDIDQLILFDKNTRKVLTENVSNGNFYAENYE